MAASRDRSDVDPSEEPSARSPADTEAQDRSPDIDAAVAHAEDRWRRTAADLDNLRKRYARDVDRERATERAKVTAAWLPVLDNLELALTHAGSDPGSIIQGVQAIRDQAVQLLEGLGYPRHCDTGVPFSPAIHEVVGVVDAPDVPAGTVVEVVRAGYGEEGSQLRPAAVVVSKRED
ncbi:nucleotide exchange factor GrpE [Nocardia brasiliensis]|uniref:nucleotide exchange factor GrpE n=1 Tax=Nocardia brasiliensis TaxID=37326 RepID=UPI00366DB662